MCGIAGIFELDHITVVEEATIVAMCNEIVYRGPDDWGVATGPGFGLGSRRLSIIDLSENGHMPMFSDDKRHLIVYNGEVYNFGEIRETLEKSGIAFHTGTDTEVVLKSYLFYGLECLKMFNGMFAFAIYDTVEKTAFVARDRLGIKPLFYVLDNHRLAIASELKSFWAAGIPKVFNHDKFEELFSFRYVAGHDTTYSKVKRLLPGCWLQIKEGEIKINQWWNLGDFALQEMSRPKGNPEKWYRETFDDAVRLREISDVPVGVLLSGGLDSSSVAASLGQNAQSTIASFTVRFSEKRYDEGDLAKLVADKYGLDYNELFIDPTSIYQKTLDIIRCNDEPVFHGSDLFVKEISEYAKSKVTVLLSGEGGDETLGGYVRYNPLRYAWLLKLGFAFKSFLNLVPVNQTRIKKLIRMLSLKSVENFILYNSSDILPEDLKRMGLVKTGNIAYRKTVLKDAISLYPNDPLRQAMYHDMKTYLCSLLDRNDLMTMRSSIECRVPFLDYRLVEGLAAMKSKDLVQNKESKSLLRRAFGKRLPPEILAGHKIGFAVPWMHYYRRIPDFRKYLAKIHEHELVTGNFSDHETIKNMVGQFLSGENSNFAMVYQLFNICMWHDLQFVKK